MLKHMIYFNIQHSLQLIALYIRRIMIYFTLPLVSAIASLFPYLPVYMKMMGLTLTEASVICGTTTFFNGFTRTLFGCLADKLNVHKPSYTVMALLSAVFFCGMVFVSQRTTTQTRNWNVDNQLHCGKNGVHVFICGGPLSGFERNGDSHFDDAMMNISININDFKWTYSIEDEQNNPVKTTLSGRCNRTNNMILNRTEPLVFELKTLQPTATKNCRALPSPISEQYSCYCYALDSPAVNDDECGGIVCHSVISILTQTHATSCPTIETGFSLV